MNNNPFFSIGIASYNYAEYIIKGLNQIKKQRFEDFEVIISDDGSTDNSVFVIKEFISMNPNMDIKLIIKDKNEGLVANKNTLIENARGEYLLLCDADDWMADDLLECAYRKIKEYNPDRLICDFAHIDTNNKIIQTEHIPEYQTKWAWLVHHASFYKMEVIKKHHISIKNEPDDVFFILEFSKYCKRVSKLDDKVYYYWLVHNDSEGRKTKDDFDDADFDKYSINEKRFLVSIINKFNEIIQNTSDARKRKSAIINRNELILTYLKLYYFDIFFRLQKVSLQKKFRYYKKLKYFSFCFLPDMLRCPYIKLTSKPRLRPYALHAVRIGVLMERLHLMPLTLIIFHFATKFMYFDQ